MSTLSEKIAWAIYDCVSGSHALADKNPFTIGSGAGADLDLGDGEEGIDCELKLLKGFGVSLTNKRPGSQLLVNGEAVNYTELALGEDYAVKVGRHFIALRGGKNLETWLSRLDHTKWFLQDSMTEARDGPMPALNLCRVARENRRHHRSAVRPMGVKAGFHLQNLWDEFGHDGSGKPASDDFAFADDDFPDVDIEGEDEGGTVFVNPAAEVITPVILSEQESESNLPPIPTAAPAQSDGTEAVPVGIPVATPAAPAAPEPTEEIHVTWEDLKRDAPAALPDQGPLQCPSCWLRFDAGDILHIAVHDSLRGDPLLGETAAKRFLPTRFNDEGLALDEFSLPCPDLACPHCHRRLPAGFVGMPQRMIPLIGDVGSGKSHYLSALLRSLPETLHREFEISLQDADPESNEAINARQRALASARSPEEAHIPPTVVDDGSYDSVSRYGRMVRLPRPFVGRVSSPARAFAPFSLAFFDNQGSDFLPGADTPDSPGTQHIAHAAGLLYLFDPFSNSNFRKLLNGQVDPQSAGKPLDRQETLLAETLLRAQRHLKLSPDRKLDTPLALVVGKHDAWSNAFSGQDQKPVIADQRLDLEAIDANSDKLRDLLRETCPKIVAAAESISSEVRYFAASSFGHSPTRIDNERLAPDPARMEPTGVDAPLLWLLAQMEPDLKLT